MNKKCINYIILISGLLTGSFFFSCSEEEYGENEYTRAITLSVNVSESKNLPPSRGGKGTVPPITERIMEGVKSPVFLRKVVTNEIFSHNQEYSGTMQDMAEESRGRSISTGDFYDSYGLIYFEYGDPLRWTTDSNNLTSMVYNEEVFRRKAWMSQEYWPGKKKCCTFFAYAPYNCEGVSITNNSNTVTGTPDMHYRVPDNGIEQKDLLICANEKDIPGDYNAIKKITFDHVLCAIRFAIGTQMAPGTITKIELRNIYREGDYIFGDTVWTNLSNKGTQSILQTFVIEDGVSNKMLTSGDNIFMVLPQTAPDDAELVITINDGETHELKSSLAGDRWPKGCTVTYFLSTAATKGTHVLAITNSGSEIAYDGGSADYCVTSYKQTYYGSQITVPWHSTYQIDGGAELENYNDSVTAFTANGNGSTGTPSYRLTVRASIPEPVDAGNEHNDALRSQPEKTTTYDLSQGGETANCYLVGAAGTYSIPLVYGNARNNPISYSSTAFVDHTGEHIQGPNIYDYYEPEDAVLIWEDNKDLIEDVRLSTDKHSILFKIPKETIRQGNAVIAVRDSGQVIMWSWHIWVTDHANELSDKTLAIPVKGSSGKITRFMKYPLGYCDADVRLYPERIFTINVYQDDPVNSADGQTASIQIKQTEKNYHFMNNAVVYQWGRKDPIMGMDKTLGRQKPYYGSTEYKFQMEGAKMTKDAIQNPMTYYTGNYYSDCDSLNLWNVANNSRTPNSDPVVKSVYDPSPVGFNVPKSDGYKQLNTNRTGAWNEGWYCYTHGPQMGGRIFIGTYGWYNSSGGYSTEGRYWTADPASSNLAWDVDVTSSGIDVRGGSNWRVDGNCVQPTVSE